MENEEIVPPAEYESLLPSLMTVKADASDSLSRRDEIPLLMTHKVELFFLSLPLLPDVSVTTVAS